MTLTGGATNDGSSATTVPTLVETARLAYSLTSRHWSEIDSVNEEIISRKRNNNNTTINNVDNSPCTEQQRRRASDKLKRVCHIDCYAENILALLLIRIVAILYHRSKSTRSLDTTETMRTARTARTTGTRSTKLSTKSTSRTKVNLMRSNSTSRSLDGVYFYDLSTSTICRIILAHDANRRRMKKRKYYDEEEQREVELTQTQTDEEENLDQTIPELKWPKELTHKVILQLKKYVHDTLRMYRGIFYHNCEHAHHVFLNANKLLDSILCEYKWRPVNLNLGVNMNNQQSVKNKRGKSNTRMFRVRTTDHFEGGGRNMDITNNNSNTNTSNNVSEEAIRQILTEDPIPRKKRLTYGIKSDPLMHFAFLFSALVHDVDHKGVSNRQLVAESDEIAIMYNDQSVQEQRSVAIAFTTLMRKQMDDLRNVLFQQSKSQQDKNQEFHRFRSNVISLVLCTDISSPERMQIVKSKWKKAFGEYHHDQSSSDHHLSPQSRRGSTETTEETYKDYLKEHEKKNTLKLVDAEITEVKQRNDRNLLLVFGNIFGKMSELARDDDDDSKSSESSTSSFGISKALDRNGAVIELYDDDSDSCSSDPDLPNSLKASAILELLLNCADIGGNIQNWETMLKWSQNLFDELKTCFTAGRGTDPAENWHGNQITFFEIYVLPLVSSIVEVEILDNDVETQMRYHVLENHVRWKLEGKQFEDRMTHPWSQLPVGVFLQSHSNSYPTDANNDPVSLRDIIADLRSENRLNYKVPPNIMLDDSGFKGNVVQRYENVGQTNKVVNDSGKEICNIDREVISGLRYLLACCVIFMNVGSNQSWGIFANLRGMPWHEHAFFLLGGYSMALPMNPIIVKKFTFVTSRIKAMYPIYLIAVTLALVNLLITCRPSTFESTFHWGAQPNDLLDADNGVAPLFCEGTPVIPTSYWGNLLTTIIISTLGLSVTPLWPMSWFLGYFFWFNNIYFQCLSIFPLAYNIIFKARNKQGLLLGVIIYLILLSYAAILLPWFFTKNTGNYESDTTTDPFIDVEYNMTSNIFRGDNYDTAVAVEDAVEDDNGHHLTNVMLLHFFLFGPFWMIYFVIGIVLAFMYNACRPADGTYPKKWGYVADTCTIIFIAIFTGIICQGHHDSDDLFLRPAEANNYQQDNAVIVELWDTVAGRLACPLTTVWIFALSTGEGFTATAFRSKFLLDYLAPNAYNCFLFHQMVSQWYFAATRNGHWWNYWRYRRLFYWFSPEPCPVEWYEYPLVLGLTTIFSHQINTFILPLMADFWRGFKRKILPKSKKETEEMIM